jgi:hypothetical protein
MATRRRIPSNTEKVLMWATISAAVLFFIFLIAVTIKSPTAEARKFVVLWSLFLSMVAALGAIVIMTTASPTGRLTPLEIYPTVLAFLAPAIVLFGATFFGEEAFKVALFVMQWTIGSLLGGGVVLLGYRYIQAVRNRTTGSPVPSSRGLWTMLGILLLYVAIMMVCDPFAERPESAKDTGADNPFPKEEPRFSEKKPAPVKKEPAPTKTVTVTIPTAPVLLEITEEKPPYHGEPNTTDDARGHLVTP